MQHIREGLILSFDLVDPQHTKELLYIFSGLIFLSYMFVFCVCGI